MTVDLLLVLRLEHKDDLNWNEVVLVGPVRLNEGHRRVNRQLSRILAQNVSQG